MEHQKNNVIPGILEQEWSLVEQKLSIFRAVAPVIHVDIIDGKFVNNTTILDPQRFKEYAQDYFLELHMMVVDPITFIEPFAKAGFRRFLGHVEKMPDQEAFIQHAHRFGEAGLALDGPTPVSAITVPFETFESVLIYTSDRVGFSGPPFNPERLQKIHEIRKHSEIVIEVDGGINSETIVLAKEAGASRFVATSAIFSKPDPLAAYHALCSAI